MVVVDGLDGVCENSPHHSKMVVAKRAMMGYRPWME